MTCFEQCMLGWSIGMIVFIALTPSLEWCIARTANWHHGWFWRLVWCLFFPVRFLFCVLLFPSLLLTVLISGVFHLAGHIAHNDGDYYDGTAMKVIGFWWVGNMWGFRSAMLSQR